MLGTCANLAWGPRLFTGPIRLATLAAIGLTAAAATAQVVLTSAGGEARPPAGSGFGQPIPIFAKSSTGAPGIILHGTLGPTTGSCQSVWEVHAGGGVDGQIRSGQRMQLHYTLSGSWTGGSVEVFGLRLTGSVFDEPAGESNPVEVVSAPIKLVSGEDARGVLDLPAFTTSGPGESWSVSFAVVWTGAAGDDTFTLALPEDGTRLSISGACPADWNADGKLDVKDFLAFFRDYKATEAAADFDGSGTVDVMDFMAFSQSYAGGCE